MDDCISYYIHAYKQKKRKNETLQFVDGEVTTVRSRGAISLPRIQEICQRRAAMGRLPVSLKTLCDRERSSPRPAAPPAGAPFRTPEKCQTPAAGRTRPARLSWISSAQYGHSLIVDDQLRAIRFPQRGGILPQAGLPPQSQHDGPVCVRIVDVGSALLTGGFSRVQLERA